MAPTPLLFFAKFMLAIFVGLGVWSIVLTIRALRRKVEPDARKLAAAKKGLLLSSWVTLPAIAIAVNAISSHQYYLLFGSAVLFSFVAPIFALYLKTSLAVKGAKSSGGAIS